MNTNLDLSYKHLLRRNISSTVFTFIIIIFASIAVLPLFLVLAYVLIKGGSQISLDLLISTPEPPGMANTAGGIGNAIVGTFVITLIASLLAIPLGVGGGIFLAEYSNSGKYSNFIRFGTNVLSGVPSIIAGVFIYISVVVTKLIMGSKYSAIAGGAALSILMLPTIIKTTDEGLKLVSDDLRKASLGVGASMFTTITQITLPSAFRTIATGIVLGVARVSGETAPLLFTALFSYYHLSGINDIFQEISSLSVLIYNFALEPYKEQNELAWAASFILVVSLLGINLFTRWLSKYASDK